MSRALALAAPELPRTEYLGGSDAPSVLGISPWRSRYRLFCEKTGTEIPPDLGLIDYVYFGTLLEPVVARVFTERVKIKVRVARKLFRHRKYPYIAGHIDRDVLGENAFLECKTANAFDYKDWGKSESGTEGVPEHYISQVDHYMLLRDCSHCYVAVLIGGNDFRWYRVDRNTEREKKLLAAEIEFWHRIKANDPPEVSNERDAKHRWKKLVEGTAIPVDLAARKRVLRLAQLQTKIKEMEKEVDEIRDWLFPTFQDRELIAHEGTALARLTAYDRTYFDADEMKKKHPKIAKRYTSTRPTKRLKILI